MAEDYLVSLDTNRYSVRFRLIGQLVEVHRRGDTVHIFHRDREVATYPLLSGTHQFRILSEHGPGASARTAANAGQPGGIRRCVPAPCRRSRFGIWPATKPCAGAYMRRRCSHEPGATGTAP